MSTNKEQEGKSTKSSSVNSSATNKTKSIGHYIIGKPIGEGTFGKVKLGTHILTGEKVAIKILEKDRIQEVADVERVAREIHILKIIRHPHIIQLYEIIETGKQLYLIMEYAQGGELFDYIVKHTRLKEKEACKFFQQILSGVEYIHKLNIVHRDLKPENLLLVHNNNLKIVDFGLSNTYKTGERLKTACGSPCYAAPEMIAGKKYVGLNVDIWSCGVILFALLCGYLPFEDPNTSHLYKKILSGDYHIPKWVGPEARDLIKKILSTDPNRRFTIGDIRAHDWYNMVSPTERKGIIVGTHQIMLDSIILKQVEQFGINQDYCKKCVEANKHNHATTTYYLLLKRHIRNGGTSASDLSGEIFEQILLNRGGKSNQGTPKGEKQGNLSRPINIMNPHPPPTAASIANSKLAIAQKYPPNTQPPLNLTMPRPPATRNPDAMNNPKNRRYLENISITPNPQGSNTPIPPPGVAYKRQMLNSIVQHSKGMGVEGESVGDPRHPDDRERTHAHHRKSGSTGGSSSKDSTNGNSRTPKEISVTSSIASTTGTGKTREDSLDPSRTLNITNDSIIYDKGQQHLPTVTFHRTSNPVPTTTGSTKYKGTTHVRIGGTPKRPHQKYATARNYNSLNASINNGTADSAEKRAANKLNNSMVEGNPGGQFNYSILKGGSNSPNRGFRTTFGTGFVLSNKYQTFGAAKTTNYTGINTRAAGPYQRGYRGSTRAGSSASPSATVNVANLYSTSYRTRGISMEGRIRTPFGGTLSPPNQSPSIMEPPSGSIPANFSTRYGGIFKYQSPRANSAMDQRYGGGPTHASVLNKSLNYPAPAPATVRAEGSGPSNVVNLIDFKVHIPTTRAPNRKHEIISRGNKTVYNKLQETSSNSKAFN